MNLKNLISNIIGIVLVVVAGVQGYLASIGTGDFNVFQLILYVAGAVIAYLTGKPTSLNKS